MNTINKEKFQRYSNIGIFLIFAAVAAPLVWAAITGIAGLLIAGGVALVGYNVAPVLSKGMTNWKYRALQAQMTTHIEKVVEAAAVNPIVKDL